jgi:hypothetical protein
MADSAAFSQACLALENDTSFSRIEARGTMRLALKGAGLDPKNVTLEQMRVVLERVLPAELENRGVPESEDICQSISRGLEQVAHGRTDETPEEVFSRLGGG